MKTQYKLLIVLLATFLIGVITIILVYKINISQTNIVSESHRNQLKRNLQLLIYENSENLKQAANDYTYWDEMVAFVHSKNRNWAEENLKTMLASYKIHSLWVFDTLKNNFYTETDTHYKKLAKFPVPLAILDSLNKKRFIRTFIFMDSCIVEITGATVHPTKDQKRLSNPQGYFFIARVWNHPYLKLMEQVTETQLSFENTALESTTSSQNNELVVFYPINDWCHNPIKFLRAQKELNYIDAYQKSNKKLLNLIISAFALSLGIFAYFLTIWVSKPLRMVEESLSTYNIQKIRKLKTYGKEFKTIGRLIVKFFHKNQELQKEKEKAENASNLKTTFLANINHEIRTPLNCIIGLSEQLITTGNDSTQKSVYNACIRKSCYDLLQIVTDVLDISKIQSKEIEIIKEEFTIRELFSELSQEFDHNKITSTNTNVQLKLLDIYNGSNPTIITDKTLLRKILINLINNALKFTKEGSVEVGSYNGIENEVVFYVKDSGIGIEETKQELIFEPFRQVEESDTRSYGGNGLGLAICKGFVELLGGKIWVVSELCKGSTFYFSLHSGH